MDGFSIGIDFGTCSIKTAYYDKKSGKINQLKIDKSDNSADKKVPNVIEYSSRTEYRVGNIAKKKKFYSPKNVVDLIKRKLELEHWSCHFEELGFGLTAEEIAEDIFIWLRERVEEQGRVIENAVVTVPVCYTEIQKNRILRSAKKAGLKIRGTITEPVAALFSIDALFEEECDENVVIFDFGGATLDLCLFHISNDGDGNVEIDIEASYGIHLGGVDITEMLYREVIYPKYREDLDYEIAQDILHYMEKSFIDETDRMKMMLFEEEEEKYEDCFDMKYSGKSLDVEMTLAEALECFQRHDLKAKVVAALDALFEDTQAIEKEDVTMVKAFGGTSRILFFREVLAEYFGMDVFDPDDFDMEEAYRAVANGAARYASILSGDGGDVAITNSIPYFIGVNRGGRFKTVLRRGQKYGVFTPYRKLAEIADLKDCWKVVLYQSFVDDDSPVDGEEGAVYFGDMMLDWNLYSDSIGVLYKFGVTGTGKVVGRFYGVKEDNEPVLIEEIEVIGGEGADAC